MSKARANGEGSIYPYKNGFAAYAWVETPAGLRKRKYVYGKTREEVHAKWVSLQQEANRGTVSTSAPSVGEFLDYWLREVIKPNRAPLTWSTYESFVRVHIAPALGKKRLNRLRSREVQSWINSVGRACQCCEQGKDAARPVAKQRCCAVGTCCESRLSARSISDLRACLRSALGDAIGEGLITANVAQAVKLPRIRKAKRKRWSTEEARRFLESARSDNDPLYAAYVLVLVLGLRKGEALGLPRDAVDFDGLEIDVRHQLQRVAGQLLHRETKTEASDEPLPMPGIVATALQIRERQRAEDRRDADVAWQETGLVFTTRHGTPIEPRNFNRSWGIRIRKAGVSSIAVHDARRTCGSLLADLDVHPRVAMRILRHAQFSVTMEVYSLVSDDSTREALRRLGDSLDG